MSFCKAVFPIFVLIFHVQLAERAACAPTSKAAKEAAEYLVRRYGKEVAEESVTSLTRRIEILALQHGDEAVVAVRKVGPNAFKVISSAGVHATHSVKLMARHGEEGVVWVLSRKSTMAIYLKHGDDAALALVKHKGIAEPAITEMGAPAIGAFVSVGPRNGRRLAMMFDEGDLRRIQRSKDLLKVVENFGDRAMDFVWKNRRGLAVSAVLGKFLSDPEPFINGKRDLMQMVGVKATSTSTKSPQATQERKNSTSKAESQTSIPSGRITLMVVACFFGIGIVVLLTVWRLRPKSSRS